MEMNSMDWYYRAAKRFAEEAANAKDNDKLRALLAKCGKDTEKISNIYFDIKINEDWIEHIERAVPHLEAAIREDRQFIKTEGNVIPIERVRKVSRASVEHLSRHSEMITHVPEEGEDLIPDRLNVYENESNFAVYENRVLYMVLCYTRDFLDYRLRKINQAWSDVASEFVFQKHLRNAGREFQFELTMNDKMLGDDEKASECRKRIESLSGNISVLLSMPLMKEVALSPMIAPPITRTNILRMDVHFKEVVALYDYLSTYTGDGFVSERHENEASPFDDSMEREVTELVLFSMYLNYKYGHNSADELEQRYQEEEQRRRDKEAEDQRKKLAMLLGTNDISDMSREELVKIISKAAESYENTCDDLRKQLRETEVWKKQAELYASREEALTKRIQEQQMLMSRKEQETKEQTNAAAKREQEQLRQMETLQNELSAEQEKSTLLQARIHGMTELYVGKNGSPDCSERDDFLELEKEREAFEALFQRNWKNAKKKMRKRILWGKKKV